METVVIYNYGKTQRDLLEEWAMNDYKNILKKLKPKFNKKLNSVIVKSNDNYKNNIRKLLNKIFIKDIVRLIVRYMPNNSTPSTTSHNQSKIPVLEQI